MPNRIQLRRTKGYRKPEGAIVVARPSKWGNPYKVATRTKGGVLITPELAVVLFHMDLTTSHSPDLLAGILAPLRGHDLACWCPLGTPCHGTVLLELANRPPTDEPC